MFYTDCIEFSWYLGILDVLQVFLTAGETLKALAHCLGWFSCKTVVEGAGHKGTPSHDPKFSRNAPSATH